MYRITSATEEQFFSMRTEWTALLEKYDHATLFHTWEWHYAWWKVWSRDLVLELNLVIARDESGELLGMAPLYLYKQSLCYGLCTITKLQFIGDSSSIKATVRSEYLDFIVSSKHKYLTLELLSYIHDNGRWSKALFSDIRTESSLSKLVMNSPDFGNNYVRISLKDVGVRIETSLQFSEYLKLLGKNTRLACYNRRKRLKELGEVRIKKNSESTGSSIDILNAFHIERWGRICFNEQAASFHRNVASFDTFIDNVDFTMVELNNKPISIIYNIDYKKTRYNIQLGFINMDKNRLSPGYLQLGYSIEDAFSTSEIDYFDLLAGYGKNSFYKERLCGETYLFHSLEVIRSPVLKLVYRSYDFYKYVRNAVK